MCFHEEGCGKGLISGYTCQSFGWKASDGKHVWGFNWVTVPHTRWVVLCDKSGKQNLSNSRSQDLCNIHILKSLDQKWILRWSCARRILLWLKFRRKEEYASCSPYLFPDRSSILNTAASDSTLFSSSYFHVLFSITWLLSSRAGKDCNKIKYTKPPKTACLPGVCLLNGEWGILNKSSKVSYGNIHMDNLTRAYLCTHVSADLRQSQCGWRFKKKMRKQAMEELCSTQRTASVKCALGSAMRWEWRITSLVSETVCVCVCGAVTRRTLSSTANTGFPSELVRTWRFLYVVDKIRHVC